MNKTIVWIYEDEHRLQPFICLTRDCLARAGHSVVVVDSESGPPLEAEHDTNKFASRGQGRAVAFWKTTSAILWRIRNWCSSTGFRMVPGGGAVAKGFKYLWMIASAVEVKPHIIITTGPQAAAVGWLANCFLGSRMVYYTMELYGEQHNHVRWWWKPFERSFVKRGIDALITQNEERARIYVEERGASVKPTIVHNYKPSRSVVSCGKLRHTLGLAQGVRIVLYEGLLGRGRWLDKLVLSAAHLPEDVRLVFMGKPSDWWINKVQPLLSTQGIAGRVLMAPWVPHGELPGYVADADVGVIIYDNSVRNNYYCEPGKLSDYVLAGVPVVAPNFPTIQPVVQQHNIGVVFTEPSPQSIAGAITRVLETPKAHWQRSIEAAQKDLVWETQYPALEQAILGETLSLLTELAESTVSHELKSECPTQ